MNPDRVEWSGDTIGVDELVEHYAYPGEAETLAVLARRLPGVPATGSPAEALNSGIMPLITGLERAGYGDADVPEWWSPELKAAIDTFVYGSELVEAWRLFSLLPEEERERVIAAAHWPM